MEKFKNIVGKIQVEKESDGKGYWIHDEECFICGSLGLNEDKVKDLINRAEGYDKAIELLKEFAFYNTDNSVKEHYERSSRVQEFLRDTYAKKWLYSILKEVGDKELEWKSDKVINQIVKDDECLSNESYIIRRIIMLKSFYDHITEVLVSNE